MSDQPRWTFCSVTLQRQKKFFAGNQKSDLNDLCKSWWTRTWICFRGKRQENISVNCREAGTARCGRRGDTSRLRCPYRIARVPRGTKPGIADAREASTIVTAAPIPTMSYKFMMSLERIRMHP